MLKHKLYFTMLHNSLSNLWKNESGLSAISVVFSLMVLVVMSIVGLFMLAQHEAPAPLSSGFSTTRTASSQSTLVDVAAASQLVTTFYTAYSPGNSSTSIEQYGTTNLSNYFDNNEQELDPIICAQTSPASFTVANVSSSPTTATFKVNQVWSNRSQTLQVTVINNGGLKIDSVACPS